ncbi:unnamed protein product [Soboliphyme baturini]|uniref:Vacuolar protein sorting-associated protein 33B n=1 Tax=Soboliphyme baturini TaxID=241478 RepID=A0A183ILT6_9BILA|nr:unnamed protein product [Soboliphyme baturini]
MGFDFDILRRIARDKFIHILESSPTGKIVVFDVSLLKPLDRIVGASILKQHGVNKIYKFHEFTAKLAENAHYCIYVVPPTVRHAQIIAQQVCDSTRECSCRFTVVFVPVKFAFCDRVLEKNGASGLIQVEEFSWSFVPLEADLLSMELPRFMAVARSLVDFQTLYGVFPAFTCIGRYSCIVERLTKTLTLDIVNSGSKFPSQTFTDAFLIDRSVDFATVFLSCLTYESLVDEFFTIQCGYVEFGPEVTKKDRPQRRLLNAGDQVFALIRDKHFSDVFRILKKSTEHLRKEFDKRQKLTTDELKHFIRTDLKDLKVEHQSLAFHITVSEVIEQRRELEEQLDFENRIISDLDYSSSFDFIRDCVALQIPENICLSLICLLSLVQNGLAQKDYNTLRSEFLQAYGHRHLVTFFALNSPSAGFRGLCKRFKLAPGDDVFRQEESGNLAYVFNGAYVPFACQTVKMAFETSKAKDEFFHSLGCLAELQRSSDEAIIPSRRSIFVCFLGGVTYAEIAGLRLLSQLKQCDICIAATSVVSPVFASVRNSVHF